jgi:hypothetical protein
MVHVYEADGSTVIEELRSSRRTKLAGLPGIEEQIAHWLAGFEPEGTPHDSSPQSPAG